MDYHRDDERPRPAPRSLSTTRRPGPGPGPEEEGEGSPADSGVSSAGGPPTSSLGTMQRDFDPNLYTYDHAARTRNNRRDSAVLGKSAGNSAGENTIGRVFQCNEYTRN